MLEITIKWPLFSVFQQQQLGLRLGSCSLHVHSSGRNEMLHQVLPVWSAKGKILNKQRILKGYLSLYLTSFFVFGRVYLSWSITKCWLMSDWKLSMKSFMLIKLFWQLPALTLKVSASKSVTMVPILTYLNWQQCLRVGSERRMLLWWNCKECAQQSCPNFCHSSTLVK